MNLLTRFVLLLGLLACVGVSVDAQTGARQKTLPVPGETLQIGEYEAFIIRPAGAGVGAGMGAGRRTPWVWYAPTLPGLPDQEERWMFERWVKAGIAIAGIDVGESYGSPDGRAGFTALYRELTERRGFASKPVLLGRSRGGLMTLNWAAENADKVAAWAGIYPVCNLVSYPGLAKASGAYGLTPRQLEETLGEHNPIDRLADLARARVPLFMIHGDVDLIVPLEDNSQELRSRYFALGGGQVRLIVPRGQGHNRWPGFFQNQELVDFVIEHARR